MPWKEAMQKLLGASSSNENDLIASISSNTTFANDQQRDLILSGMRWLGLFSSEQVSDCPAK